MADVEQVERDDERPRGSRDTPTIVAIGASAGGVQALQAFFAALPSDTGAAFVVVVHLDPERHSELSAVLSGRAKIPVVEVSGRVPLRADHAYVIPPDRRLQLDDHELVASTFDEPRGTRA